jgi:branched-subunit amino acid aminotransferase/4-amino-4-deoxychorismate lyase
MAVMREIRNGRLSAGPGTPEPAGARGVFETALLAAGRPVFFEEHFERFAAGCAHFGLTRPPAAGTLLEAAEQLVRRTALSRGVLRWSAWSVGGAEEWRISVEPPRPHMAAGAWRVALSPLRLPPPDAEVSYKHLGRKRWLDALAAGRAAGSDEVLLADEAGGIVEGAISNVFWVSAGALATPAVSSGLLPGIVRAKVLALARAGGFAVAERILPRAELAGAGEIFLTNSLVGIRPVAWLEGRGLPAPGPVTLRLQAAWRRLYGWG